MDDPSVSVKINVPQERMAPVNQMLNDIPVWVAETKLQEVTSSAIFLPSTVQPHPEGLFSEAIFGPKGSPTRLTRHGYIKLKTRVFHPDVYDDLLKLNRLYGLIMSGRKTAMFDPVAKDFVPVGADENTEGKIIGTGFNFFFQHYHKIEFRQTDSGQRADRITFINMYKKEREVTDWPVLPAGLRDIKIKDVTERPEIEASNKLYTRLLMYTGAIPDGIPTDSSIWDGVRYSIQRQLQAINAFFLNDFLSDKAGFIQKRLVTRSVVYATRNVLIGTKLSEASSRGVKQTPLDTKIPLFQAAKGYLPLVIHHLNKVFLQNLFDANSSKFIYAAENKSLQFVRLEPSEHDIAKNFSRKSIENFIKEFGVVELRHRPFTLTVRKEKYYPFLCYDNNNTIVLFRNLEEFKTLFKENTGEDADISKVRPLTNTEILYVATHRAVDSKYMATTRYPVLGLGSKYSSRPMLMTTDPGRKIDLVDITVSSKNTVPIHFSAWPVFKGEFADGYRVHPMYLYPAQLAGDYDGDKVNSIGYWGADTCEEIKNRLSKPGALLTSGGTLRIKAVCAITDQTMKNLSIVTKE